MTPQNSFRSLQRGLLLDSNEDEIEMEEDKLFMQSFDGARVQGVKVSRELGKMREEARLFEKQRHDEIVSWERSDQSRLIVYAAAA